MPDPKRQKIMLITRNLPPLVGGMERLNWHMADELSKYAEVQVIGPSGSAARKPENVTLREAPLKPLPLFLVVTFLKGLWLALRWRPDTILAGSGLTAPTAWLLSKLCSAHSAAYLHGFDITVDHAIYRKLWRPSFKKLDHVIVNSTPTRDLALAAGVAPDRISIVFPGVTLPKAPQPESNIRAFKQKHGLEGKKILLSVGRLTTRKGLREFVEFSLPDIVKAEPNAVLIVVGEAPKNSLGAGIQSIESIQYKANTSGVGEHIKFLGVITNPAQLATAYEAADVHVFPVRHIPDDPEGFGMVAIEAAAQGLQTVAFATGGVVDAVKKERSGYLVPVNEYPQFSEKVVWSLKNPLDRINLSEFAKQFEWSVFGRGVITALPKTNSESNNVEVPERLAHATKDLASRVPKAKKIEKLLDMSERFGERKIRMLEVGCGSGGIAHYFATHTRLDCEVTGVDVQDNRQVLDGYRFIRVSDVTLPFPDATFDVVITNHVIEHVGEAEQQLKHLTEIHRVMAHGAVCYLAVPNRWMITEPHYKLKFLSWLPRTWRTPYLRWRRKGNHYDCKPLQLKETELLLRNSGFRYENLSIPATRTTLLLEKPDTYTTKLVQSIPTTVLDPFRRIIPTLIYKLEKYEKSKN